MRRWFQPFDRDRVQDWLPGTLGISAAILLVVVAANSPIQTSSTPAEVSPSQSTALASKDAPSPSQRAPPQTPALTTPTVLLPTAAVTTGEAARPAPIHDHAIVKAQAEPVAAPQAPSNPDKDQQKTAAAGAAGKQGDTAGRQIFKKCQTCHSMEPGKTLLGPSLAGIVGRKSGADANFNYSPALKQAALTWDAATLDAYLMDPQKIVPGNRMPFPGLKTDRDRKDVIAFLATPASPAASNPKAAAPSAAAAAPQTKPGNNAAYLTDAKYTLRSGIAEGRMVFLGVGGAIDGKVNPVLTAAEGQVCRLTLINGEGAEHDIVFPDQDAKSPRVTGKGASTTIVFRAGQVRRLHLFLQRSRPPTRRHAGSVPGDAAASAANAGRSRHFARTSTDLPPPIGKREPQTVRVDLFTVELEGRLAEGTTFGYWTFNGKVPGPFVRVRVGDTVDVHLKNRPTAR